MGQQLQRNLNSNLNFLSKLSELIRCLDAKITASDVDLSQLDEVSEQLGNLSLSSEVTTGRSSEATSRLSLLSSKNNWNFQFGRWNIPVRTHFDPSVLADSAVVTVGATFAFYWCCT